MIYRSMLSVETISRHSVDILTNLSSADTILDILANSYRSSVGISIHALGLEYLFTNIPTRLNTLDCYTQQNCRHFMAIHYFCHRAGEIISCEESVIFFANLAYISHIRLSHNFQIFGIKSLCIFFQNNYVPSRSIGDVCNVNNYFRLFATH